MGLVGGQFYEEDWSAGIQSVDEQNERQFAYSAQGSFGAVNNWRGRPRGRSESSTDFHTLKH
jgi:hypothetical protein